MAYRFWFLLILSSCLFAEIPIFPLRDVRPGLHGTGQTIFSGNRVESFDVEVLGVLENLGPKQSVILARLSGGVLAETGVMQGMSGSPVYINGRLVGAVALAFAWSKEPIAGIRPIEEMLRAGGQTGTQLEVRPVSLFRPDLLPAPPATETAGMDDRMTPIATPVSFNGFSENVLAHFAPQLRRLGLEPRQGLSSGGHLPPTMGNPGALRPGDMITVQLLSGDMSVGADGTVTAVDGKRVYAFGHQFLSVGATDLPFARADVIAVLPSLQSSFKISSAREWMGAITQDRSTAIYGELGRHAPTIPLAIDVSGGAGTLSRYRMEMVSDQILSPFLVQMAVYSAIETTERTFGAGTFVVHGRAEFSSGIAPLKFDNTYSGDFSVPQQASLGVASSLSWVMGAGFDALKLRNVSVSIEAIEQKRSLEIDQIAASRRFVRPGEPLDIAITLSGPNGMELVKRARFQVPVGTRAGALELTASDALTTNLLEYGQAIGLTPKSPAQVVSLINDLRPNTNAYIRIWTTAPAYDVQGVDLPSPPPSLGLILARAQSAPGSLSLARGSEVAELAVDAGPYVVSGSKTTQVEVKE